VRNRDFNAGSLIKVIDIISLETEFDGSLLFLECSTDVLARRYSETRRRHPLAPDETPLDGITRELALLGGLRERADILIDTSETTPHDLRAEIAKLFGSESDQGMAVSVQSFSYKRGLPHGLDMVLDCRFLRNPHWDKTLRALNGQDAQVGAYIKQDENFEPFFTRILDLVELLLPAYRTEGKSHFTLGLGCTGGQHRSVYVTECLANALAEKAWQVSIRHRELERRAGGAHLGQ
jgi:RNase adapter protein RapZ